MIETWKCTDKSCNLEYTLDNQTDYDLIINTICDGLTLFLTIKESE